LFSVSSRMRSIEIHADHFELRADGDPKVQSTQSFSVAQAPDGLPMPGEPCFKIDYAFEPGWKFVCLSPNTEQQKIDGRPTSLGMWLKGDGSGNIPRMRFVDSTGQTFQPDGERLTFTDWRYILFPLNGTAAGHWGGANDGMVHYPIRLETMLLIDSAARQKT